MSDEPTHPERATGTEVVQVDATTFEVRTRDGRRHRLNDTALALWRLCDGRTSPEEMAASVSELFAVDERQARADVQAALQALADARLISDARP